MNPVTLHQLKHFMNAAAEYVTIAAVILTDGDERYTERVGEMILKTARLSLPIEPTYPELRKYLQAITNDVARRLAAKGN